jgi:hypothetical protein
LTCDQHSRCRVRCVACCVQEYLFVHTLLMERVVLADGTRLGWEESQVS